MAFAFHVRATGYLAVNWIAENAPKALDLPVIL
jgi:hypothetical protein